MKLYTKTFRIMAVWCELGDAGFISSLEAHFMPEKGQDDV